MKFDRDEYICQALFVVLVIVAVFLTPYIALEVSTWI